MAKKIGTMEYFIEKVRIRPNLWNKSHILYLNNARKYSSWERVAKECGLANGREAKLQWKKLRDSHREAMRRRQPSAGPSAQHLQPWKYEENMKFIVSQMDNKEPALIVDCNDNDESSNDTTEANHSNIETSAIKDDPDWEKITDDRQRQQDELLRQFIDINRRDALSKFFDSMYEQTRELPRYLQLRVQRELFAAVTKAEEEALSMDTPMNGMPINNINATSFVVDQDYAVEDDKILIQKNLDM